VSVDKHGVAQFGIQAALTHFAINFLSQQRKAAAVEALLFKQIQLSCDKTRKEMQRYEIPDPAENLQPDR
jgi:hypothetical protein